MKDTFSVPVLLLTGYLGSGKTTLLNRVLTNQKGIRFAVIVNDLGEVNIDADLIQKGGVVSSQNDDLVALQNGCICCTLKMDLVQQLHDLCAARQFDYIVIEASGICEPAPIAQTICNYTRLVPFTEDPYPRLDCIVTVVDALRLRDEFASGDDLQRKDLDEEDLASLVIQQIEFCNLILLNKASEISEGERAHVRAVIRAIQPQAEIIDCDYCDVPMERLVNTGLFNFDDVAGSAAWLQGVEGAVEEDHNDDDDDDHDEHHHEHHEEHEHDDHEHHHHHHHHHEDEGEAEEYGVGTFVYYRRRPFSLNRFDDFVARLWDKHIIRCKGMCYFSNEPDMCYLFEQAGRQFNLKQAGEFYATMPKEELMQMMAQDPILRRDWDEKYGDRMQKLVFIGQHLDRETIEHNLDNCLD
ncbi:MAG: GTP-binding protein [Paludibacteraceae bacterium]|nr:GTP-binding protein [Paludibacteraceae bacterium]